MKIDVKGGRMLLVISEGAVADVEDRQRGTKAILVANHGSLLHFNKELIGACFVDGAAIDIADTDSEWLKEALKFLGFVVYRKPKRKEKRRG